jgi:restriction system protein
MIHFKLNFAIKELGYVGLISYVKYNPQITLTQNGASVDLLNFDVKTEVRDKARIYWEEHSAKNKAKNKPVVTPDVEDEDNESSEDELLDDFKVKLQSAIANMSPANLSSFREHFSRRWEYSSRIRESRFLMMVA